MSHIYEENQACSTPLPKNFDKASDWLLLIPFGIHHHPKGIQKFTKSEAHEVLHHFNSLAGLISRRFKGLPVYADNKELGSTGKMEVRDNGLWALIRWNDYGRNLLHKPSRHSLTPIWTLRSAFPDVITPYKLIKINLITHKPIKNLKTKSITHNLLGSNAPTFNNREHFLSLVDAHMQKSGNEYLESWNFIKNNHPKLYQSII